MFEATSLHFAFVWFAGFDIVSILAVCMAFGFGVIGMVSAEGTATGKPKPKTQPFRRIDPGTSLMLSPEQIILSNKVQARWQPDGVVNMEHVIRLAKSIKEYGQLSAVGIWQDPKNSYQFVASDGHHRIAAIQWLRENDAECKDLQVKCVVRDSGTVVSAYLTSLAENLDRDDYSPMDIAANIVKMQDFGMKPKEIAERFNKSSVWITNIAKLLEYPVAIQKAIHKGLSYTAVLSLDKNGLDEEDAERIVATAQATALERMTKQGLKTSEIKAYEADPSIIRATELQDAYKATMEEKPLPRISGVKEIAPGTVELQLHNVTKFAVRTVNTAAKKGENKYIGAKMVNIPPSDFERATVQLSPADHGQPLGTTLSFLPYGFVNGNERLGAAVDFKLSAPETPRVETPRPPDGNTANPDAPKSGETSDSGTPGTPTSASETSVAPPTQTTDQTPKLPGSVSVGAVRKFDDLKPLMDRIAQRYGGNDPASKLAATIISYHLVKDTGEDKVVMAVNDLRDYVSPERQAEFKATFEKPLLSELHKAESKVTELQLALETAIAERDAKAALVAKHGKK